MIVPTLAALLLAVSPTVQDSPEELGDLERGAMLWNGWAATLVLTGVGLHIGGVVTMQSSGHRDPGLQLMIWGTVFNAHALVAVGLGSWYRGRVLGADHTKPPAWKNPRVGWALFGTGLAVFVASRVAPMGCFTTRCAVLTSEIGYFGGLTAMIAGLHAAAVGHGYSFQRRTSITPTARVTPRESFVGLAFSGRF